MEQETNAWASRRKAIYFGGLVLVLTGLATLAFLKFWYTTPSCSDGMQNGDEVGVDCGGSCQLVCSSVASKPVLRFDPRLFRVASSTYSALAFVDNYNTDSTANLPYRFQIFDENGGLIYEREGVTLLPKKQTIAVFEGNIVIENSRLPKKVFFEMDTDLSWQKDLSEPPEILITHSPLLREDTSPRVEAVVSNKSLEDLKNLELVAVVFDGKDNPIAASRTFVERLNKGEKTNVFFTWPRPFELGEVVCEKPSDVVLAIDRSGSMQSLSQNPPEPLTSVKKAASSFVDLLKDSDSVGLVSFATEATVDSLIMQNETGLKTFIDNVMIAQGTTQYTNIADAITKSFEALAVSGVSTQKIIVLLTDGVATKPSDPKGSKSEALEIAYAEGVALKVAEEVKNAGVLVYTIGLGKDIHTDFLKKIASTPENFLLAPATSTLESVYAQVSTSICKELPSRIEVRYKVMN